MLLENWRDLEQQFGSQQAQAELQKKMPAVVTKRRPIITEDGVTCALYQLTLLDVLFL